MKGHRRTLPGRPLRLGICKPRLPQPSGLGCWELPCPQDRETGGATPVCSKAPAPSHPDRSCESVWASCFRSEDSGERVPSIWTPPGGRARGRGGGIPAIGGDRINSTDGGEGNGIWGLQGSRLVAVPLLFQPWNYEHGGPNSILFWVWQGDCSLHCRMFNSISGLAYSKSESSSPPSYDNSSFYTLLNTPWR